MKKILCALVVLTLAAAPPARALETVTVPLPGVEGRYWVDTLGMVPHYSRAFHFRMERIPISVNRVWIHLSGTAVTGEMRCAPSYVGDPNVGPYPLPLGLYPAFVDTVSGGVLGATCRMPDDGGAFDCTSRLDPILGYETWDFLEAAYGNILVDASFMILVECWPTIWPEATIESAELLIEGEFPVAVERTTWGSIKSLYGGDRR